MIRKHIFLTRNKWTLNQFVSKFSKIRNFDNSYKILRAGLFFCQICRKFEMILWYWVLTKTSNFKTIKVLKRNIHKCLTRRKFDPKNRNERLKRYLAQKCSSCLIFLKSYKFEEISFSVYYFISSRFFFFTSPVFSAVPNFFLGAALPCSRGFRSLVKSWYFLLIRK